MFGKLLNKKDRCYLLASATDEKSVQVYRRRGALSFGLAQKKQKPKACILSCKNLRKS